MPRKRVEINPEYGKRIKQICEEQGIKQKKLGELIHLSEKTISSMVRGHSSITRGTAEAIIDVFPEYRIEWLLGVDDIKTWKVKSEEEKRESEEYLQRFDEKLSAIIRLAELDHYTISRTRDDGITIIPISVSYESNPIGVQLSHHAVFALVSEITDIVHAILYNALSFAGFEFLSGSRETHYSLIPPSQVVKMKRFLIDQQGRHPHDSQEQ